MATTNSDYSKVTIDRELKKMYGDGIINFRPSEKVNIYFDNFSPNHIYCKCTVKPKLPEYPAVYAHVKYGGFNIGTICITNIQGKMFHGNSLCSPEDQFNKKIGRDIAYRRAYENTWLNIPEEYKKVFDETYDYLVQIAKKKLFSEKKFEEVTPKIAKYPYVGVYALSGGVSKYGQLKVLFTQENLGYVVDSGVSHFRVSGEKEVFYENKFKNIFKVIL